MVVNGPTSSPMAPKFCDNEAFCVYVVDCKLTIRLGTVRKRVTSVLV